jgi:hypothetical protein
VTLKALINGRQNIFCGGEVARRWPMPDTAAKGSDIDAASE